jgi:hypothetical protein
MKKKKVWFVGFSRRFWVPVSVEGWLATLFFFAGILLIGMLNRSLSGVSLTVPQVISILIEFACVLGALYFVTKGHVDKRY